MIVAAVMYTFAAEDADSAEAMLHQLRDAVRSNEAGCLRFDVARSSDDPCVFFLWEEYADRAALETHRGTEHFTRLALNGVRKLAKARVGHICRAID
jgi:quinol monooxygenase YgiN